MTEDTTRELRGIHRKQKRRRWVGLAAVLLAAVLGGLTGAALISIANRAEERADRLGTAADALCEQVRADGGVCVVDPVEVREGRPGDVGPSGPPGRPGLDGRDGRDGAPGSPGPPGEGGEPGDDGIQGGTGPDGLQGPAGNVGPSGPPGPAGADGQPGEVGPSGPPGPTGPTCPDGFNLERRQVLGPPPETWFVCVEGDGT